MALGVALHPQPTRTPMATKLHPALAKGKCQQDSSPKKSDGNAHLTAGGQYAGTLAGVKPHPALEIGMNSQDSPFETPQSICAALTQSHGVRHRENQLQARTSGPTRREPIQTTQPLIGGKIIGAGRRAQDTEGELLRAERSLKGGAGKTLIFNEAPAHRLRSNEVSNTPSAALVNLANGTPRSPKTSSAAVSTASKTRLSPAQRISSQRAAVQLMKPVRESLPSEVGKVPGLTFREAPGASTNLSGARSSSSNSSSTARKIGIRIVSQFFVSDSDEYCRQDNKRDFVNTLAKVHNAHMRLRHPRHPGMVETLLKDCEKCDSSKWSLTTNVRVRDDGEKPWGLEMRTSMLDAGPCSRWREDVAVSWKYLGQHYRIYADEICVNQIHISLCPGLGPEDLQRMVSSTTHFNSAIEALLPRERRPSGRGKRDWLESPSIGKMTGSRCQPVDLMKIGPQLLNLLPQKDDKSFSWNFWSLDEGQTIEFRKSPASLTADDTLGWAEFTMTFVQASLGLGCSGSLRDFEPNVAGLRRFLEQVRIPGVNEPQRWQKIWRGRKPAAKSGPVYASANASPRNR